MSDFSPITDPRAIEQRIGFTSMEVVSVDDGTDADLRVVVSNVDDVSHLRDLFAVLWNDPDGVEVVEGAATCSVHLYETG